MDKRGHLLITTQFSEDLSRRHRFCLKIGSILPDILVYTYITGHTWAASYEKIQKKMKRLARKGKRNCRSFLSLGYIVHYIEDYFTWPHNVWFDGDMTAHIRYEKAFTVYLQERERETVRSGDVGGMVSAEFLLEFLRCIHQDYEQEQNGFENDCKYIIWAADCTVSSYCQMFRQNEWAAKNSYKLRKSTQPVVLSGLRENFFY